MNASAVDPHGQFRWSRRTLLASALAAGGLGVSAPVLSACARGSNRGAPPPEPTVHRIGWLGNIRRGTAQDTFVLRLQELGYEQGKTWRLDGRYWSREPRRAEALAAELVTLPVAVLVADGDHAIRAAQQATNTIPTVMAVTSDPVRSGFVRSLAHPGGNITGVRLSMLELSGKLLQLLSAIVPALHHVGIIGDPADPDTTEEMAQLEAAAAGLGLRVSGVEVETRMVLPERLAAAKAAGVGAVVVLGVPGGDVGLINVEDAALPLDLPLAVTTATGFSPLARGTLLAYGFDPDEAFRRVADLVDRILRGTPPGVLPLEQPTRFALRINLTTARALHLTVPQDILRQATEVIQ